MYHLFRKTVQGKNGKEVRRWYYWFYDTDMKRKLRVCPGYSCRVDAEAYLKTLPQKIVVGNLIKYIAKDMFLLGSDHVLRRAKLGKSVATDSLIDSRRYIITIISLWGDVSITELSVKMIIDSLLSIDRSPSWKNRVITILKEVYHEATWQGINVTLPMIPTYDIYSIFYLCLLTGLRLGEARGIQYE